MTDPLVILVNSDDLEIGSAPKSVVHQKGLLHRAFSVLLYRVHQGQVEVLLQQREKEKYHTGGLWTNTCCSHPTPGESTQAGAERRLFEEVGISVSLTPIGSFRYYASFGNALIEHELDHVFIAEWPTLPDAFNRAEIEAMQWMPVRVLQRELDLHPQAYTPWLEKVIEQFQLTRSQA